MRGKVISSKCCDDLFWDHPRLCGEKLWRCKERRVVLGSPPPMRGKVIYDSGKPNVVRITPAYAGKRLARVFVHFASRDHPRLCGEKRCSTRYRSDATGSPPPMRGKVVQVNQLQTRFQDHPRLCGEKFLTTEKINLMLGSPPPMRGKVFNQIDQKQLPRITPAYAGKSAQIEQAKFVPQDHPRLCGEKTLKIRFFRTLIGSPPPMRGKVIYIIQTLSDFRITPAYAGKRQR